MNYHKASIIFSKHTPLTRKQQTTSDLHIQPRLSLWRYLDTHFSSFKCLTQDFLHLLNKTDKKLNSWSNIFLSRAGRIVLIQSSLEVTPSSVIAPLKAPNKTAKSLDALNRNFFWKNSSKSQGIPLISWDEICQPESLGRLCLRKNKASKPSFFSQIRIENIVKPLQSMD